MYTRYQNVENARAWYDSATSSLLMQTEGTQKYYQYLSNINDSTATSPL